MPIEPKDYKVYLATSLHYLFCLRMVNVWLGLVGIIEQSEMISFPHPHPLPKWKSEFKGLLFSELQMQWIKFLPGCSLT